jgi:hypothetical protein
LASQLTPMKVVTMQANAMIMMTEEGAPLQVGLARV